MRKLYYSLYQKIPKNIINRFYFGIFLIGIVGILEIFSLSALIGFFKFGFQGQNTENIPLILNIIDKVGETQFITILLVISVSIFIIKSFFILFVNKYSYNTAIAAKKYLQDNLYWSYININFSSYTKETSSEWVRNIIIDCNAIEGRFFTPILVLLGEIIPAICICGVLAYINYQAFLLAIFIFLVTGLLIYYFTYKKMVLLGKLQQQSEHEIVLSIQNAFNGIREIKLYELENWSKNKFLEHSNSNAYAINKALFIGLLPKFVFEVAVYLSLGAVFLLYLWGGGAPIATVIAEFSIFGAAAMRLMPSVSKVVSHLQSLKHAETSISAVLEKLRILAISKDVLEAKCLDEKFNQMTLKDINYEYLEKNKVLENISLNINVGDIIGIIGGSGSGKTTLINLVIGLLKPTSGEILVNGRSLESSKHWLWSILAYVPQEPFLVDDTIIGNVLMENIQDNKNTVRVENILNSLGLSSDNLNYYAPIGEGGSRISGGQRQRLAIARAIFRNPEILILDEVTSAMDEKTQFKVLDFIIKSFQGKTIIMITHRPETLNYCNKTIRLV